MIKTAKERDAFRRTPIWQVFRRYMYSSRDYTCEFCGKQYKMEGALNVHHKYETNYDNLDVSRFAVLCKTCHEFIHSKYNAPAFHDARWYGNKD